MKGTHSDEGVHDYESASAYIEENARDPNACALPGSRTCLRRWPHPHATKEKIVVLYAHEAIVTYRRKPEPTITLDAGGRRDETMRDRLNSYTPDPVGVAEENGEWEFQSPLGTFHYHDGFEFDVEAVCQRRGDVTQ